MSDIQKFLTHTVQMKRTNGKLERQFYNLKVLNPHGSDETARAVYTNAQ